MNFLIQKIKTSACKKCLLCQIMKYIQFKMFLLMNQFHNNFINIMAFKIWSNGYRMTVKNWFGNDYGWNVTEAFY